MFLESCQAFSYQPAIKQCKVTNKSLLDGIQLVYAEDDRVFYQSATLPRVILRKENYETATCCNSKITFQDHGIRLQENDILIFECQKRNATVPQKYRYEVLVGEK